MGRYAFPDVTQIAIPFFVIAILIELWLVRTGRAKGEFETRDALTSLLMGTGNVVAGLLLGFVSYTALVWLWQYRLFNLGLSLWVFLAAFLLDDLRYYWYHRIAHRVRWVWAEHVNHHSSQLYNMVGFQTKLKHGEQTRIFRMIPALEHAEFARLGGLHRNTYINSPTLLSGDLQLRGRPGLRFAGQITGCEGYVESASIGLLAGRFAAAERLGHPLSPPPATTAFGALLGHITGGHIVSDDEPGKRSFQPMNVNFGLFPPLDAGTKLKPDDFEGRFRGKDKSVARKKAITGRALADCREWLGRHHPAQAAE